MLHIVLLVAAAVLEGQVQLPPPSRPATDGKAKAAAERKVGPESLEVRYARAQLKLAEANLSRVQQSNQQMERTVPSSIVAEYQDDVRVAKMQLQQVTSGASAGGPLTSSITEAVTSGRPYAISARRRGVA